MLATRTRVTRGARLLDEHFSDWHSRVDVDLLDVESVRNCPLGQASGLNYFDAVVALGVVDVAMNPVRYGFDVPHRTLPVETLAYRRVTRAWRRLVARRARERRS